MKSEAMYYSEGQVSENVGAIVFLIIGVAIATLVLIFVGILGGQVYTNVEPQIELLAQTTINESQYMLNGTAVSLSYDDIIDASIVITHNNTGLVYPIADFSLNNNTGAITLINNSMNGTWNFSYNSGDPVTQGYIKESIISGFKALNTSGSYLPIVVLAVIIFIVLGIVMGMGMRNIGMSSRPGGAL